MRRIAARILPPLAGLLVFLLVLGSFAAAAPHPSAAAPPPAELSVPLAKAGDRALYSQEIVGHNGRAGSFGDAPTPTEIEHGPAPWMAFTMTDVRETIGGNRVYVADITHYDMRLHDGTPLRTFSVEVDGGRTGGEVPAANDRSDGRAGGDGGDVYGGGQHAFWDCMLWSTLNGRTARLSGPELALYQDCDIWTAETTSPGGGTGVSGSGGLDATLGFVALGGDIVGEHQAVVFRHDWYGSFALVWMSPDLPYPLLVALGEKGSPSGEGPQLITYRLERFQPGDGKPLSSATPVSLPSQKTTSPIAMAPARPWGLDESGTRLAFPASQAWAAAEADTTAGVGQWLSEHPQALTWQARSAHQIDEGPGGLRTEDRTWTFAVAEGVTGIQFTVRQSVQSATFPSTVAGVPTSVAVRNTTTVQAPQDQQPGADSTKALSSYPTLAALEALWRDRLHPTGELAELDAWSLTLGTKGDGSLDWNVEVGHDLRRTTTDVVQPSPTTEETSLLSVLDSGATIEGRQASGDGGPSGAPAPAPPFNTAGLSLQSASIDEASWRNPVTFAAAGGAGLLAATLAGLLVWKPSVFGVALFSRIAEERVLEHPMRRRLAQLVAAQPGLHRAELVRRAGGSRTGTAHHIARLVAAGAIVEVRIGKYVAYRPGTASASTPAGPQGPISLPGSAHVLDTIRATPGLSAADLGRVLGLAPATVHHHVQRLREAGLIGDSSALQPA